MNYLQACKKVALRCGVSSTGPASVINQTGHHLLVTQWVADAYEEICSKWFNWKFLWARTEYLTTSGEAVLQSPDDLGIWDHRAIRVDGESIDIIEYDASDDSYDLSMGTPEFGVIMPDNSLMLYPTPDGTYTVTIDYFKKANIPEENASTFLIPERYQRAIIGRAMMFYGGYENAAEVKQEGMEMYQMAMDQLESHELPNSAYRNAVNTGSADIRVIPQ